MAINKKMTIEEILRTDYGIANILTGYFFMNLPNVGFS